MDRTSQQDSVESKKARVHFGLKSLLVVMTIIGVGLGIHVGFHSKVKAKRDLREKLVSLDAEFDLEHESVENLTKKSLWKGDGFTDAEYAPPGPEFLRRIYGQDAFFEFTSINLRSGWFTDELLESALRQPKLASLEIEGEVNERNRGLLANSALRDLTLFGSEIEDALVAISKIETLEYLNIRCEELTLKGIDAIGAVTNLEDLTIQVNKNVSSEVLSRIGSCDRLKLLLLKFPECQKDVFELSSIANLKNLEGLSITDGAFVFDTSDVRFAKSLKSIWLTRVALPNHTPGQLGCFESLEQLYCCSFRFEGIGNSDLPSIGKLRKLNRLSLDVPLDEENLVELSKLTELRYLSLHHPCSAFQAEDIKFIGHMNNLESVMLNPNSSEAGDLDFLYHPKSLTSIHIGGNTDPFVTQTLIKRQWWNPQRRLIHFSNDGAWYDLGSTDFGGLSGWAPY